MSKINFPEISDKYDICPYCGKRSVRAKELWEGGGIVCMTKGCNYWFCY